MIEQDDVKRIEEIQARLDGAEKPGKIGHGGAILFHSHAIDDVRWLLDQLTASRNRNAELENAMSWKIYAERRQAEVIAEYKKEHAIEMGLAEQLAASRQECERLRGLLDGFPRPPLCINTPDDLGGKL